MGQGRIAEAEGRRSHPRVWFGDVLAGYAQVGDQALRAEVLAVGPSRRPRA
jgi:hypothetical protein